MMGMAKPSDGPTTNRSMCREIKYGGEFDNEDKEWWSPKKWLSAKARISGMMAQTNSIEEVEEVREGLKSVIEGRDDQIDKLVDKHIKRINKLKR